MDFCLYSKSSWQSFNTFVFQIEEMHSIRNIESMKKKEMIKVNESEIKRMEVRKKIIIF